MSFRYQKRIPISKGLGLNVSNGGISPSYRSRLGSVSTRGFTLKTGIPGLSFRKSWGKHPALLITFLIYVVIVIMVLVTINVFRLLIYLMSKAYDLIKNTMARRRG